MREMPFQRHKFQNVSERACPRTPLVGRALRRVRVSRLGAAYSSFAPGGKWACYASVNSEYSYRDFLKTPGFTALPYAKVRDFCVIFY